MSSFTSMYSDESEYCLNEKNVISWNATFQSFDIGNWFQYSSIKRTNLNTIRQNKESYQVVSVSFFRANVDNHSPEYEDTALAYDDWEKKYWRGLKKLIQQIHFLNTGTNDPWILRIYMSKQLADEGFDKKIFLELALNPSVPLELYTMCSFSIGAQPGMLWRFLPFSDQLINLCVVLDIDDDGLSEFKLKAITSFKESKHSLFGRYVGRGGVDGCYHVCRESEAKNYPAVLGSFVMFKPRKAGLSDIDKVMQRFISRMIHRSKELFSEPPDKLSPYDQVVHSHVYGWGGHWTMYGFDERFLKQVLLYYYGKQGAVFSLIQKEAVHIREVCIDCRYVQKNHCQNVFLIF